MIPERLLYRNKDGLTCAVTVELDGKAPGFPTGATLNPSHARQQHSRRPYNTEGKSIALLLQTVCRQGSISLYEKSRMLEERG